MYPGERCGRSFSRTGVTVVVRGQVGGRSEVGMYGGGEAFAT